VGDRADHQIVAFAIRFGQFKSVLALDFVLTSFMFTGV